MTSYEKLKKQLVDSPAQWLVTGAAGFIGSNLVETLLGLDQRVTGLDNFSNGHQRNLDQVRAAVSPAQWARFKFIEGDIRDLDTCRRACAGAPLVLHQAALGSVPKSMENPLAFHDANTTGTLHMLLAARDAGVPRFVYASSSSVYGDDATLPKVEPLIGNALSPYAATKLTNEIYAQVFGRCFGLQTVGLRYFNVFGPRQDPEGAYAAVISKWIASMLLNQTVHINGDGETSRDFCYVANVVQANLAAATSTNPKAVNQVYNVAVSERTTLNQLFNMLRQRLLPRCPHLRDSKPIYGEFRAGDVRHSLADITRVRKLLNYRPTHLLADGLDEALDWYVASLTGAKTPAKTKSAASGSKKQRAPLMA